MAWQWAAFVSPMASFVWREGWTIGLSLKTRRVSGRCGSSGRPPAEAAGQSEVSPRVENQFSPMGKSMLPALAGFPH
jgi:hypothetical protein